MIKKYIFLVFLITIFGCDSENASDCFQKSGTIIQQDFNVSNFTKIVVWDDVQLIVKQGDTQLVIVETGENLMNEIKVSVTNNILEIKNENTCNLIRDYGLTKVYVTTPELREIRNNTGFLIEGKGLIAFAELQLISDDTDEQGEYRNEGGFKMENLAVNSLEVFSNGIAAFYLKGEVSEFKIQLYDGDVRVEARELEAQHVYIYHRSTNKIIVNPILSIKGRIVGLGDVISVNHPPIVEVEELYTGKLIFE